MTVSYPFTLLVNRILPPTEVAGLADGASQGGLVGGLHLPLHEQETNPLHAEPTSAGGADIAVGGQLPQAVYAGEVDKDHENEGGKGYGEANGGSSHGGLLSCGVYVSCNYIIQRTRGKVNQPF